MTDLRLYFRAKNKEITSKKTACSIHQMQMQFE
jgi:hypothetical protein